MGSILKRFTILLLVAFGMTTSALSQNKATQSLTLTVNPGLVAISTASIPNGMVGKPYSATIVASGGLLPYNFSVSLGTLPAGLVLDPLTGKITGTPTAAATTTFTVKASDSEVPTVSATQSYTVLIVPTLVITSTTLPAANIGVAYSVTLAATGGVAPYTWSVTTGSLPSGLTLDPATGKISGTPTAVGSFTFTITVTDSATFTAAVFGEVRLEIAVMRKTADNKS